MATESSLTAPADETPEPAPLTVQNEDTDSDSTLASSESAPVANKDLAEVDARTPSLASSEAEGSAIPLPKSHGETRALPRKPHRVLPSL